MTMLAAGILALALLVLLVAVLEHLDTRARERRWQKALASFGWDDQRTPLVEPPPTKRMLSLKGPTRL